MNPVESHVIGVWRRLRESGKTITMNDMLNDLYESYGNRKSEFRKQKISPRDLKNHVYRFFQDKFEFKLVETISNPDTAQETRKLHVNGNQFSKFGVNF